MKKILNKKISILIFTLIILIYITTSFFSYKDKIKAQEEFIESSLGFLSYGGLNEDELEDFRDEFENIEVFYGSENGQIFYNSGFKNFTVKAYEFQSQDVVKKTNTNYITNDKKLIAKKTGENIMALEYESPSFAMFFLKRSNILIFILSIAFLTTNIIGDRIYQNLIFYFSDLFKDKTDLKEFYQNPKAFLLKEKDKKNYIIRKNHMLKSRIANIEKISSNMEEGFIYFNKDGSPLILNEAAKNLLGVSDDVHIDELIKSDDYKLALRETRLLKRGKSVDVDLGDLSLRLFIDPIIDSNLTSFIILIIDDTKNKRAEIMRREFTANVSHELKSPLTSINGYAELIATGLAKDGDIKEFGKIINEEGKRLLNIIDDILKLSRLDEENLDQARESINIKDVVDNTIKNFKNLTDKKDISIINQSYDYTIRTHGSLFKDLITNIYENAIKYNKESGKIYINFKENERYLNLIIKDTGIGIKKEQIPRIFERFYVADKQRTRTLKSTGLGLSIVKHICDYLNFDISVESEYGYGTSFIISIPKNWFKNILIFDIIVTSK